MTADQINFSATPGETFVWPPRNILASVSPTANWINVAQYAVALARAFDAVLYMADIIYDPFGYRGWNLPIPSFREEYLRLLQDARDRLTAVIEHERQKGFPIESIVTEGKPVEQIVRIIKEKAIDLLVLPAHEENRLEHAFYGKTNEHLIRRMPCSIVLLKQPE